MSKAKQERLPGMTPAHIAELEDKAEELKGFETERLDAAQREKKARTELRDLMKAHRLKRYDLDERREIVIEGGEEKAFVRNKKGVKKAKAEKDADTEAVA